MATLMDRLQQEALMPLGLKALATATTGSASKLVLVSEADKSFLLQEWSLSPFRQRSSFKLRELKAMEKMNDTVQIVFSSNKMISLIFDNDTSKLIKSVISKYNELYPDLSLALTNLSPDALLNDEFDLGPASYEALGTKETQDLRQLINECDYAVSEADRFAEDISKELRLLDGANVHSILASETSVASLMSLLERAEQHAEAIDNRLNSYDQMLEHVRVSLGGTSNSIEVVNANNAKLFQTLESLIDQLQLNQQQANLLSDADSVISERGGRKLTELSSAANSLKAILEVDVDQRLHNMTAVQDQIKMAERLRDRLAKAISRHLANLLVHMANSSDNMASTLGSSVSLSHLSQRTLCLVRRKPMHEELMHYSQLVHWLKAMDSKAFVGLKSVYTQNVSKVYERDLKRFFELARFKVNNASNNNASNELLGSSRSKASSANLQQSTFSMNLLGGDSDNLSMTSESSNSERERFDDALEVILSELGDVCMDEQFFAKSFFNLHANDDEEESRRKEETRQLMSQVFPTLEQELLAFITHFERIDAFFTLYALVRLGGHVLSTQHDTGSFLAFVFGSVLVHTKRNLDKFMERQRKSIEDYKGKSQNQILSFVSRLEFFFRTTENVLRGSERRVEIDKWYVIIVSEVMKAIERVAISTGNNDDVVRLENYHHLHGVLAQFKIASLDALRKEAKQKYAEALANYVTRHFGRPLEQLTKFFEGVQQLLNAGVKESEVGYQMRFSKQELRKLVAAYPGREVKRGLESLYKKTRKQLSEEENLMPVVWRAMQEEFLKQYNNMQELITKCYAGAQIELDFTVDDLLRYFSDIAAAAN